MKGFETCALCPRLCRPSCPVASGASREAAVPAVIGGVLYEWHKGWVGADLAIDAATLCTDCGACQDHCLLDRPLPELLRRSRAELLPPPVPEPLQPIEGTEGPVAVEADARPLAEALQKHLGRPVRRWGTGDRLGEALRAYPGWDAWAGTLRQAAGGLELIVVDGGVAQALEAAQIPFQWLQEWVDDLPTGCGSCVRPGAVSPLRCCGAAGPLPRYHPDDARRVGEHWLREQTGDHVEDGRCRGHLRALGGRVSDPLDALMAKVGLHDR